MGKLFGTDGIRGVVGENLTADMAFRVGQAVGTVLMEDKGSRPTVVIGKDTRISSDMLESALMAGLCSVGSDVKPVGTIPTPAVAYLTVQEKADAGIVISASHNPYEHNGIKVFSGQGYKLSDSVEARIEEKILSQEPMKLRTRGEIGRRHHGMRQLKRDYIDFVASTIESDLAGLKILADCANGAASATAPELFGRFKARTDFIHRDPDGVNINSHCGSTHLEDLAAAVVRGGYDIGVAFDGDADRCLLVDETGGVIDGDKVLAVCALDMKRRGKLNGNALVATVMSNLGLHEFCRNNGIDLLCTDVGDRNVLEKMLERDYRIGGEQSGHTIFTDVETTGDGEVTALQFLQVLARSGEKASSLVSCCAVYPQVLVNVEVPHSGGVKEAIMASPALAEAVKREEEALAGAGRVLVRPSGTEALIRVMSNLGLHEFCRNNGIDLLCTDVGDRNVLEKMLERDYRIGGEQSGHTIFTDVETTGDGEVTALQFLQVLARSGEKASSLVSCCAVYPQVLVNVEVPHSGGVKEAIMASPALAEAVKREEEALAGAGRVLVRPSGTEALIRVMVEAKTTQIAQAVADRLADFIKSQKK